MKRLVMAAAAVLSLSLPASAGEILLPVVHRGEGVGGAVWRTEIIVSNVSDGLQTVRPAITLHREDGPPISISTPLVANETLDVDDAVFNWFGLEEGGGIVRVTWDGPGTISARARIYNATASGQFGQGVPGLTLDELKVESHLTGLSGVNGNRTNIGISNPHEENVTVWIALFDQTGTARGEFAWVVPARSHRQLNDVFKWFQAGPLHGANVYVTSMSKPVYVYGSVIRSDSGDPTFVLAD